MGWSGIACYGNICNHTIQCMQVELLGALTRSAQGCRTWPQAAWDRWQCHVRIHIEHWFICTGNTVLYCKRAVSICPGYVFTSARFVTVAVTVSHNCRKIFPENQHLESPNTDKYRKGSSHFKVR